MGTATTPRHRAEKSPTALWGDLRRRAAHLLAGRDLYADDAILRPTGTRPAGVVKPTAVDEARTSLLPATRSGIPSPT